LVLFFFASQLIALFKKTNLGTVFTIKIIDIMENLNFSGTPLIILFFILVALVNIFQTSSALKWTILAPSIIPLFMRKNISPEFTQAIFRAGDSITNIVSPFFPYFVVLIGMLQLYNKQEEAIGIRYTYKLLFPYLIGILIFWLLVLMCWYIINLPIGVGVNPIL
jgi:aminobenzoyl-glutamate transport protein